MFAINICVSITIIILNIFEFIYADEDASEISKSTLFFITNEIIFFKYNSSSYSAYIRTDISPIYIRRKMRLAGRKFVGSTNSMHQF